MLTAFTEQAERADREVIFRTLERRRRRGRRHAHQPRVVRGGARRHRLPAAHRLDEVHARRLLQPPAAQPHPRGRRPAPHRRVPEPARVRELRRVPERPRRALPGGAAALHRREPARRGHLDVDPGRRPVARRAAVARAEGRVLAALRAQHRARRRASRATPMPTPRRSPPTGRAAGSPTTRRPCGRSARRWPSRARRSPTGSTSARSPTGASSRSASSRRR